MSKPVKLEQSIGPSNNYFICLFMENTVSPTASIANNDTITPEFTVNDSNNKLMANQYSTAGNFYFVGSHGKTQNNYIQVVSEGSVGFFTKMSIDGVNWSTATPTGIAGTLTGGTPTGPVSSILPFPGSPAGLNYRITSTGPTGKYYINVLY